VQLVGSKSPQPVGTAKPVLTAGGKTLVTTSLPGVKLVNAVKTITTPDGTQQQTIFIKPQQQQLPEQQQQQQTIIGTIQQQPQLLQQHANKVSRVAAHTASIYTHSEKILHFLGGVTNVGESASFSNAHRIEAGQSLMLLFAK
jgi:hypothetical protein